MSPSWSERCEDSCFQDKSGNPKFVVSQWLESLTHGFLHSGLASILANMPRKTLKKQPEDRPKIEDICAKFTLISLKAHLITVREWLYQCMKDHTSTRIEQTSAGTKLWFESERLAAFGYVTGLDSDKMISLSSGKLNSRYDEYIEILKTMVVLFQEVELESSTSEPDAIRESENGSEQRDHFSKRLENDICEQVEFLWNLLPVNEKRKAEAAWLRAILDTKDVRRLNNVERAFKSEDDPTYEKGTAMAMMKSDWK